MPGTVAGMPMLARRLLPHYSRPRWTVDTAVPAGTINASGANGRATLTLALAGFGLINVIGGLGVPWSALVTTLLLALSARAFFAAAQRFPDKRFAWLLSASVAVGLTIASSYNLIRTPNARAAVAATCIAIVLLVVRGLTGRRQRRWSQPT
jgi:hypothetical protein